VAHALTGQHVDTGDVEQAGLRLGQLLDAWRAADLRPFLQGGAHACTRLIITRRPRLLPDQAARRSVKVDQLSHTQARAVLAAADAELGQVDLSRLVELTGRWPLLVRLASGRLAADLAGGGRAVGQCAHLLTPIEPAHALQDVLVSRLDGHPGLRRLTKRYQAQLPRHPKMAWVARSEPGPGRRGCPSHRSCRARRRFLQPGHALLRCPDWARAAEQVGVGRRAELRARAAVDGQARAHPVLHTSSPRLAGYGGTAGGECRRRSSMPSDPVRAVRHSGHYREVASAQWP
jgi:hypothetical protein